MKINIAIDGPSGSGKSSISKILSNKLGLTHLDTGSMYRAVAFACLKNNIDVKNEEDIVNFIKNIKISFNDKNEISIDDENVSSLIRTNEISMLASDISAFAKVRELLVEMQKNIAAKKGYILDGRDIGTVVLKNAEVKIFLTANSEVRAYRRMLQNKELGIESDFEKIKKDIEARDYQDINRKASPLKKADDAILIDASYMTIDEVVDSIVDIIETRIKND